MKNLILTLIFGLTTFFYNSQTPVNVYVIHQGCPYGITDTWASQCFGIGSMTLDSVDYQGFQDLYFYQIPDTCYPIQLTMCVYVGATGPPFPQQTPFCLTQTINGGGAITLLADCSVLEVSEIRLESDDFVSITNLLGQPTGLRSGEVLLVITKSGQHKKIFIED